MVCLQILLTHSSFGNRDCVFLHLFNVSKGEIFLIIHLSTHFNFERELTKEIHICFRDLGVPMPNFVFHEGKFVFFDGGI